MKKTVLFLVICLFGSYVFAFPGNFSEERFGFFNASGDAGILSSIKEEKGSDNLMGSFNSCFRRMTRLIRSLDLNEEQIEKIHAIKTETLIKAIPMGSDLAVAGIKLHSEMKKDKVNEKEVNKLIEEFTKVQADLMKTAANTVSRIKKELTPEQLKKFKTLMQKRFYGKKHLKARKKRNHRSKHGLGNKRNHRARHGMQDNDNARHGMQGNNRICRDRHFRHHSDVERYKGFEHSSKYGEYRNKKHNGSSYFKKGKMNKSLKGVRKKSAAPGKRNIFKQIISKLKRAEKALNLNDEQKTRIEDIKTQTIIKGLKTGATLAVEGVKLSAEMRKDSIDEKEVNRIIDEFTKNQAEFMKIGAAAVINVKSELTAEQLKTLNDLRHNRFKNKKFKGIKSHKNVKTFEKKILKENSEQKKNIENNDKVNESSDL